MNPDWKQIVRERLAILRLPPEREIEIVEEVALHLEAIYDDALLDGLSEAEAQTRAVQSYDWRLLECELSRVERPWQPPAATLEWLERKGGMRMESCWQDLRFGVRMLVKQPGFTLIAVLTLALGIGANGVIFSLVQASLLRPLPGVATDGLLYVFSGNPNAPYNNSSYPDYAEFRDRNQAFSGLAAYGGITASLGAEERTELVTGGIVSGNYFDVLGVNAAVGRTLTTADDQAPGAHPVAVISHRLWQRSFGGNANVIGQPVRLNGQSFTVIGVLPAVYKSVLPGRLDDLYVPLMMQPVMRPPRGGYSGEMNSDLLKVRGNRWLTMIGRLKSGVTLEQARASLTPITEQQARDFPNTNSNRIATLTRASEGDPENRGLLKRVAALLLSIVGIVLLIACANVANLLLVRASARRKEIAIRLALGAGRLRLVRQLLTESVLLAVAGGVIGMLLAVWGVEVLKAAPPPPGVLPLTPDFAFDGRVLMFTFALSLLTGVVFGLAPAWQSTRANLVAALKDETQTLDQKRRRGNLRNALVVAQVALSLLLLIGAGLFLRSLWRAQAITPGFDAAQVLTAPLSINLLRFTREQGRQFYQQAAERVAALPGVQSVSLTRILPLAGNASVRGLMIEGRTGPRDNFRSEGGGANVNSADTLSVSVIGQNFFPTMGIALRNGRDFSATDTADSPPVVIVNETFAARHFPNEEALGKRLSLNGDKGPWRTIIGIARDSKYATLGEAATPYGYLPLAQNHETGMTLLVRTAGNPAALTTQVRQTLQSLETNLPLANVQPLAEVLGNSLYAARMGAMLVGVFGVLALLLAVVGLYGVMSFVVARRTREIGIRMALGARGADVVRLLLREGMTLVALGCAIGLASAWLLARLLSSFLYNLSATDPLTFGGVALLLASVALLACWIPARRATKVDPLIALRSE
jgi:predicted permease